nr:CRISPR-associated helicase Cas3' [uncultured Acidocella sp.]
MQNSSSVPPTIPEFLYYWGKSKDADGALTWHPAAYHMLDVAAVAQGWLLASRPIIPGLGPWRDAFAQPLTLMIALHDIGKFSRPFQAKVASLWPSALGAYDPRPEPRHDTAGYWLMQDPDVRHRISRLLPTDRPNEEKVLWRAVCGHHGRPPSEQKIDRRAFCDASRAAALACIDALLALLRPSSLPELSEEGVTALGWWLAGLTVLADWVGSAETWFPYVAPTLSLDQYWTLACKKAEWALASAGLLPAFPAPAFGLLSLIGDNPPTPLQKFVAQVPLPDGPMLVLIEDQMGSGKTEAALLFAHRLMQAQGAAGLFMALPTMATANAMYARLGKAKNALFVNESEPSLVLVHGKSRLMVTNDADETASAQCAAWIGDDRRRSFLAACGAGTIDQAVLSVLPSRHAPLRLFGLSQRVLIIDEAHTYDEYVTEELRRLIEFQTRQGGSTIVLSATLPRSVRQRLVEAFGQEEACQKAGYPLVTLASRTGLEEHDVAPRPGLDRRIELHRLPNADAALEVVRAAAARGAAVGWIRNTVDDAVAAHAALGQQATLFHARFALGDRLAIEGAVQMRFGKTSIAGQRAHVVVGTQVMEQSLDLDFDILITDLAPVDLLLQRAGRLWRHARQGRPEAAPRLYVIAPPPVATPDKDWLRDFRGTAAVYRDPALLWRSCRALLTKSVLDLPGDVRVLVETVYDPEAEVPDGLAAQSMKAIGKDSAARGAAWQNLLSWSKGYAQDGGAWQSDVMTPTRLADPSKSYRLAVWNQGVLAPLCQGENAWAMSEITLPLRLVQGAPEEAGARAAALEGMRGGWTRWEQEIPVLILEPEGEGYRGEVLDAAGDKRAFLYSRKFGFTPKESISGGC